MAISGALQMRCQFLPRHCAGRGIRGSICGIVAGAAGTGGARRDRAWETPWDRVQRIQRLKVAI